MMKLYKTTVKSISGYTSPLHSDTLFGAFCWSYIYLYGDTDFEKDIIIPASSGSPSIVFSNAFLQGYLPLPYGIRDPLINQIRATETDKRRIRDNYSDAKSRKNASLIDVETFKRIQKNDAAGFSRLQKKEKYFELENRHNSIDREDNICKKTTEGSHLYSVHEVYDDTSSYKDVYVLSDIPEEKLRVTLKLMFEMGIGGRKSVGKGMFEVTDNLTEWDNYERPDKSNAYITLSNLVPARDDPTEGFYKPAVKYAKLDKEFASDEYPFKKPFMYIMPGAVFKDNKGIVKKGFCGRALCNMANRKENIIQSGYSIILPLVVDRFA